MIPTPKKILIVDDHAMFAETLGQYLRMMFKDFEITVVTSAEKAREQASRQSMDVVLLDLEMSDCSGLTLLADFSSAVPSPACIIVSMHLQALWIERALKAGACGYVAKDSPPSEIVNAINYALLGKKYLSRSVAQSFAENAVRLPMGGKELHKVLSDREFEIFLQLAHGKSLKIISLDLSLSAKTVSVHKHNIWKKTGINSVAKIARYCVEHGLLSGSGQAPLAA
ncbi:response regulator transcription factor [Prosthecobacter sp.]|uniref:response regulator transcription factor n=1 Tax=Prosthecobacter sp. TaxID=1965333 RepID=UPI002ABA5DA5|nr:response regulator transcription factor [Prosthecobacter sp.]MDZ4404518.1 response regulator transcription factor [Prosthecobacter sp.]